MSILESLYTDLKYKKGEIIDYKRQFPPFFNLELNDKKELVEILDEEKRNKMKILFVSPRMDDFGCNTHIYPALYLLYRGKYCTSCITNIAKSKQELDTTAGDFMIPDDIIPLCDIIVFPFVHYDLSGAYRAIRGMNKEKNRHCKIVFTVDYDFYNIPEHHLKHDLFQDEKIISAVEKNIIYADKAIIPSDRFRDLLNLKIENKYPDIKKDAAVLTIAPYTTKISYNGIDFEQPNKLEKDFGKKRLGVITSWHNKHYIQKNKELFDYIFEKYKNQLEVVFYGIDPLQKKVDKLPSNEKDGLVESPRGRKKYRVFPQKPYMYFHKNLFNLNFDAVLYLAGDDEFTKNNAEPKIFFESIFYDLPVISNYDTTLFEKGTHYLYGKDIEELKKQIDYCFFMEQPVEEMVLAAKDFMFRNYDMSGDKIEMAYLSFLKPTDEEEEKTPEPPIENEPQK